MRKASDQRLLRRFFDNVAMPCNGRAADSPSSAAEAPREGDFSAPALGCTARRETVATVASAGIDFDLQNVLQLAVRAVHVSSSSLSCVGALENLAPRLGGDVGMLRTRWFGRSMLSHQMRAMPVQRGQFLKATPLRD